MSGRERTLMHAQSCHATSSLRDNIIPDRVVPLKAIGPKMTFQNHLKIVNT